MNKKINFSFTILLIIVFWFYLWTVTAGKYQFDLYEYPTHQYTYLTEAFNHASLDLSLKTPPGLLQLSNPYDMHKNYFYRSHGYQDYALYKKKLYVYFGPSPVITFFLPIKLLTGLYASDGMAILFFCTLSFIISFLILSLIREKYSSNIPDTLFLFLLLVLSVGNISPYLLRVSSVYCVAISCASSFLLVSIYFFIKAFNCSIYKSSKFIFLGSLFLGLTVGARFYYILASCLVLKIIFDKINLEPRLNQIVNIRKILFIPFLFIVGVIFAYNYLRFDNFFENGSSYVLAALSPKLLYLEGLTSNFVNYFFIPPIVGSQFPYLFTQFWQPSFTIFEGREKIVGIICYFPMILIPLFFKTNNPCIKSIFSSFEFKLISFPAILNLICLLCFQYVSMRYLGDFIGLIILSVFYIIFYLYEKYSSIPQKIYYLNILIFISGLITILCSLAFSITGENHGLLFQNPELFKELDSFFRINSH